MISEAMITETVDTVSDMGITVADIQKAILGGGDAALSIPALRRALENDSITSVSSLGVPVPLPEATALLGYVDSDLSSLLRT